MLQAHHDDNLVDSKARCESSNNSFRQTVYASENSLIDNIVRGEMDDSLQSPTRSKRRKVSRDSDKKYACRHEGCSKRYGRVEHLYRHELNHEPKSIFRCMQPGCDRRFVRQDLLNRHVSRHSNHESGQIRTSKARYDLAVTYRDESPPGASEARKDSTVDPDQAFVQSSAELAKDNADVGGSSYRPILAPRSLSSVEQSPPQRGYQPLSPSIDHTERSLDSDGGSADTSTGMPVRSMRRSPNIAMRDSEQRPSRLVRDQMSFKSNKDFIAWLFGPEDASQTWDVRDPHPDSNHDRSVKHATATMGSIPSPSKRRSLPPRAFETRMSFARRRALVDFVVETFKSSNNTELQQRRNAVLDGDLDKYPHVLSLPMLETYLSAFWESIHPQLSILHRPTFAVDTSPDLLLLCILALGATNIDRSHSADLRRKSSEFAFFVTWHVRHKLFTETGFGPPAQVWVLRTLLMLEVLEKMFTSCRLHDRAQVHHCTTINLLRRSQNLIAVPSGIDGAFPTAATDPDGSLDCNDENTEQEWQLWIAAEAIRRIAFAAFVIDTTHAHMFGQTAYMTTHEMELVLPCDEAMWAAESMAEVEAIRDRLEAKGYTQVGFHEALRKTLNSTPVKTNTLGRVSIMAGLLNVMWQINVHGVPITPPNDEQDSEWSQRLVNAYDFWKEDFDNSLSVLATFPPRDNRMVKCNAATGPSLGQGLLTSYGELDRDNVFEARTVLYHLAHISTAADLSDCMLFAGSTRLLDHIPTSQDQAVASYRLRTSWAVSKRAHSAVFFALRFLSTVLIPEPAYTVRNDVLLNRPWVLYLAALVLWAYVFAIHGPSAEYSPRQGSGERATGARAYLVAVNKMVRRPEDVPLSAEGLRGRGLVCLLGHLQDEFRSATWECLHDAAETLGACIARLMPSGV